jgi:hypothetical protein
MAHCTRSGIGECGEEDQRQCVPVPQDGRQIEPAHAGQPFVEYGEVKALCGEQIFGILRGPGDGDGVTVCRQRLCQRARDKLVVFDQKKLRAVAQ